MYTSSIFPYSPWVGKIVPSGGKGGGGARRRGKKVSLIGSQYSDCIVIGRGEKLHQNNTEYFRIDPHLRFFLAQKLFDPFAICEFLSKVDSRYSYIVIFRIDSTYTRLWNSTLVTCSRRPCTCNPPTF